MYADYMFFSTTGQFWMLALARSMFAVYGIASVLVFKRLSNPVTYDWLLEGFLVWRNLLLIYLTTTRPVEFAGPALTKVLAVLSVYFVFQTPMMFRIAPAFLTSSGVILVTILRSSSVSPQ